MAEKTIAAISTPYAAGGIGVIRVSGDDAIAICEKVFRPITDKKVSEMKGYTAAYGTVFDETDIDDAVLLVFRAPKSYTGEDVCEISCHGGLLVLEKTLQALIKAGAEPAGAGEFTKRAFLNGKMTLTQAESVADTINAQGVQAMSAALAAREGALFRRITAVNKKLLGVSAHLSAWIDYPDEEIDDVGLKDFEDTVNDAINELDELEKSFYTGRVMREGIRTAIVGKPNVGKSTLMNLLSGYKRSIVTDIAGTTRDVIEETVRLGKVILRLADTAGIRETDDTVEKMGVELAEENIKTADLVLAVFDVSVPLDENDFKVIEAIKDRPAIAVVNKTDLEHNADVELLKKEFENLLEMSAKTAENADTLAQMADRMFETDKLDTSAGIIANQRQLACVREAKQRLEEARECLAQGFTLDAADVCINTASQALLELTGESVTDAVVSEVFANFCVGK